MKKTIRNGSDDANGYDEIKKKLCRAHKQASNIWEKEIDFIYGFVSVI